MGAPLLGGEEDAVLAHEHPPVPVLLGREAEASQVELQTRDGTWSEEEGRGGGEKGGNDLLSSS